MIGKFVAENEWSYKCRDCRSARRSGGAKLTTEILAGRHAREHPGHQVDLYWTRLMHTFSVEDQQALPLDVPPF